MINGIYQSGISILPSQTNPWRNGISSAFLVMTSTGYVWLHVQFVNASRIHMWTKDYWGGSFVDFGYANIGGFVGS